MEQIHPRADAIISEALLPLEAVEERLKLFKLMPGTEPWQQEAIEAAIRNLEEAQKQLMLMV